MRTITINKVQKKYIIECYIIKEIKNLKLERSNENHRTKLQIYTKTWL